MERISTVVPTTLATLFIIAESGDGFACRLRCHGLGVASCPCHRIQRTTTREVRSDSLDLLQPHGSVPPRTPTRHRHFEYINAGLVTFSVAE